MVRLKAEGRIFQRGRLSKFQFHYGSIKGILIDKHPLTIIGFNSTMVRLKVVDNQIIYKGAQVSIPLWFD